MPKININYIEKLTNERAGVLIVAAKVFSVPDNVISNFDIALRGGTNHGTNQSVLDLHSSLEHGRYRGTGPSKSD